MQCSMHWALLFLAGAEVATAAVVPAQHNAWAGLAAAAPGALANATHTQSTVIKQERVQTETCFV